MQDRMGVEQTRRSSLSPRRPMAKPLGESACDEFPTLLAKAFTHLSKMSSCQEVKSSPTVGQHMLGSKTKATSILSEKLASEGWRLSCCQEFTALPPCLSAGFWERIKEPSATNTWTTTSTNSRFD